MDLALGLICAGYHLWKCGRKSTADGCSYLVTIPPEIRLIIYDFVFEPPDESKRASHLLMPLLTCRLIYQEACGLAFSRVNFFVSIRVPQPPFWSPRILRLPATKLARVRKITVLWAIDVMHLDALRSFFTQLAFVPLQLEQLTFWVTNPQAIDAFRYRFAPLLPNIRDFGRYVMGELPPIDNVAKIVIASPWIENKRNFQHLFDPHKPNMDFGDGPGLPNLEMRKKKLGNWTYTVIRPGKDVKKWKLELTHPQPKVLKKQLDPSSESTLKKL